MKNYYKISSIHSENMILHLWLKTHINSCWKNGGKNRILILIEFKHIILIHIRQSQMLPFLLVPSKRRWSIHIRTNAIHLHRDLTLSSVGLKSSKKKKHKIGFSKMKFHYFRTVAIHFNRRCVWFIFNWYHFQKLSFFHKHENTFGGNSSNGVLINRWIWIKFYVINEDFDTNSIDNRAIYSVWLMSPDSIKIIKSDIVEWMRSVYLYDRSSRLTAAVAHYNEDMDLEFYEMHGKCMVSMMAVDTDHGSK